MDIARIPVYQIDVLTIQALLTQTTISSVGNTQGRARESNTEKVRSEFNESEGEKQRMNFSSD